MSNDLWGLSIFPKLKLSQKSSRPTRVLSSDDFSVRQEGKKLEQVKNANHNLTQYIKIIYTCNRRNTNATIPHSIPRKTLVVHELCMLANSSMENGE